MSPRWYAEPAVWSYAVALIGFGWLSLRLIFRWKASGKPAMLLAFALAAAGGAAAAGAFAAAPTRLGWFLYLLLDFARSAATFGFLLAYLGVRRGAGSGKGRREGWALLVGVAVVLLFAQLLFGVAPPGLANPSPAGFFVELAAAIFGLVLVEQCYRSTAPATRWHVRPLMLGLGGVLAFELVMYSDGLLFRMLDGTLWTSRGFVQLVTVPLFLVTLNRTRDWSFDLSLSRGVLSGTTALIAIGVYLVGLSGAGFLVRELGGAWGAALETTLVFAALLLLVALGLSATARAKVRVLVANHFFTYRYDYRAEWLRLTNTLAAADPSRPWSSCIKALADLVESPGGALWFRGADGAYQQIDRSSFAGSGEPIAEGDPLPAFLSRTGWVIEIGDAAANPAKYDGLVLPLQVRDARDAWIVVPLQAGNHLAGFVVLATPRVAIELDWEVLDLLKTAGRQAASYLAYAQAAEALLESRKFDAFHRMSTFVVHDLKNLIAQLRLVLSNIERHRDNPEFQRDMLRTLEHVVGRMHQLTLQLRPEASVRDQPTPVDVGAVARRVQALRIGERNGVTVEAAPGLIAWANEDLLERVIAHLVQNGVEASDGTPDVRVRVMRDGERVLIEVSDRGRGMTEEFIRNRLFRPFETTKETGMGIGTYEIRQYVREVGGQIEVDSAPAEGTRVRVWMPAGPSAASELAA